MIDSPLAAASRWVREGPFAPRLPWRLRTALERWTASHAYPSVGETLRIRVSDDPPAATLLFGGDVALHRWSAGADAEEVFGGLHDLLDSCDARFYNLESQLTTRTTPAGTVGSFLRGEPSAVAALHALRVTAVTCANNHCLDFGTDALAESVAALESSGIVACGVPREDGCLAKVVTVRGVRVGLLAYTDDWHEPEDVRAAPRPAAHEPSRVASDIGAARAIADIVVVQLHWGWEWAMYPPRTLRDLARSYVEAGADLVICHHAHVPLGVERWRDGVIAHGLGNFYFGAKRWWSHPFGGRSFVLRTSISSRRVVGVEVVPIHTSTDGRVVASAGRGRDETLRAIGCLSRRLHDDVYHDRVERNAIALHGAMVLRDLAERVGGGAPHGQGGADDSSGARERIRFMRCPRQRWLIEAMQQPFGGAGTSAGASVSSEPATSETAGTPRVRRAIGNPRQGGALGFLRQGGGILERLRESATELERSSIRERIEVVGAAADQWLRTALQLGRLP